MKRKRKIALLLFIVFANSCSNKYAATNKVYKKQIRTFTREWRKQPPSIDSTLAAGYWAGTTNFGMRKPQFVIIHHTAQTACDITLRTFTLPRTQASAHYVICKDGTVHHMLNDYLRAWHAGVSKWGTITDVNSISIGIELDNNGFEPFTGAQVNSLLLVLKYLEKEYNIPLANFIGHADVAPGRKVDPSRYFPWEQLAQKGFGLWYDTTNLRVPGDFNALQGLRTIGYSIKDSAAAIRSFKLHFVQNDTINKGLTGSDKKIIYDLYKKTPL